MLSKGSKGGIHLWPLVYTGATFSCVGEDLIEDSDAPSPLREPPMIATASEGHYR